MLLLERAEPDRPDRGRRPRRRWVVPPAPAFRRQPFEGAYVLDEVRGPTGLALFYVLRAVELWSGLTAKERIGLFVECATGVLPPFVAGACGETPEIEPFLNAFGQVVVDPVGADPRGVARACSGIAEWADSKSFVSIACDFAELAARVQPADSTLAFHAGRLSRIHADYERAKQWFLRAVAIARLSNDLPAYSRAFLGWGIMEEQRGNASEARRLLNKAWAAAKRGRLRELGAFAQHELLILAITTAGFEAAHRHAVIAARLYGPRGERLHRLANDVAFLWAWHGYFAAAFPVIEAAQPLFQRRADRISVAANLGRAAAALGDVERFFRSWDEVVDFGVNGAEGAAAALANIAEGARTLGLVSRACDVASRALQLARSRGEKAAEDLARKVLESIRDDRPRDEARDPPPEILLLAEQLVGQLTELRASDRTVLGGSRHL